MATAALIIAVALCVLNLLSIILAGFRIQASSARITFQSASVTIIRPVCGLDENDIETLTSTFSLDHKDLEIIFCAASADDPAVPVVSGLIRQFPDKRAWLIVSNSEISQNPKLNNMARAWGAASGSWVILADSNVILPPDFVGRLLARWRSEVGLVASPPLASHPRGFWAELECAFINTYQARWQFAADAGGLGFAQGKVMLWNRAQLNAWGGLKALTDDIAEDAAATKLVRGHGFKVRLADAPFEQPIGHRTFRQVLDRQRRWARMRRGSFPRLFAGELLSTALIPVLLSLSGGWTAPIIMLCATITWYGAEMMLAWSKGWHLSWRSPAAFLARDVLISWIYIDAWVRNDFEWRGNKMKVVT